MGTTRLDDAVRALDGAVLGPAAPDPQRGPRGRETSGERGSDRTVAPARFL
jgi:hypothetical protein